MILFNNDLGEPVIAGSTIMAIDGRWFDVFSVTGEAPFKIGATPEGTDPDEQGDFFDPIFFELTEAGK